MKVKVIKACWFGNKLYDPDLSAVDIIIDYPCEDADKLPSWAEPVGAVKTKAANKEGQKGKEGEANNAKVGELPVTEKNTLLEEAKAAGIEGNQILGWKVETLKAKIAAAKKDKEGEGEEEKGEGKDE